MNQSLFMNLFLMVKMWFCRHSLLKLTTITSVFCYSVPILFFCFFCFENDLIIASVELSSEHKVILGCEQNTQGNVCLAVVANAIDRQFKLPQQHLYTCIELFSRTTGKCSNLLVKSQPVFVSLSFQIF